MGSEAKVPAMSTLTRLVDSLEEAPDTVRKVLSDPHLDPDAADQFAVDLVWLLRSVNEKFSALSAVQSQASEVASIAARIAIAHVRLRAHAGPLQQAMMINIERFFVSSAYSAAAAPCFAPCEAGHAMAA